MRRSQIGKIVRHSLPLILILCLSIVSPEWSAADDRLDALLERTGRQTSSFLGLLSETNCTEHVLQEKFGEKGKVIEKEASTYDYLIILSTEGGDLNLVESSLLTDFERGWLNIYHARVRDTIAPLVDEETRTWLDRATRSI